MRFCVILRSCGLWVLVTLMAGCGFSPAPLTVPNQSFAGKKAGEERSDNVLKMKFCWCPKGKFKMGSPMNEADRKTNEGQVDVTLSQGFWMGKFEVTQDEWQRVMAKESGGFGGKTLPIDWVSWDGTTEFCRI